MIALSAGGLMAAICRLLNPPQEIPIIPTRPLHQGCSLSQRMTATPSSISDCRYWSTSTPSDSPEPRISTLMQA